MKRRNWLIATLAALFVLQAPLCVFACLTGGAPDPSIDEARHDLPPCHEQVPASQTPEPSETHEDCGCGDSYEAVLVSAEQTLSDAHNSPMLPPTTRGALLDPTLIETRKILPNKADLPPPDILLLNSTLLI